MYILDNTTIDLYNDDSSGFANIITFFPNINVNYLQQYGYFQELKYTYGNISNYKYTDSDISYNELGKIVYARNITDTSFNHNIGNLSDNDINMQDTQYRHYIDFDVSYNTLCEKYELTKQNTSWRRYIRMRCRSFFATFDRKAFMRFNKTR